MPIFLLTQLFTSSPFVSRSFTVSLQRLAGMGRRESALGQAKGE